MNRDGHLAVGLFAQLAAVLVLHADGVLALLGEAGIVEDKDSLGTGEGSSHHGAVAVENLLFVPRTLVDELLQGLFGIANRAELGRERDTADHRLDALAFAILDQTAEVDAAPGTLGLVSKIVLKEPGVIPEPVHDFGGQFGCKGLVHTIHTNKDTGRFVKFNGVVLELIEAGSAQPIVPPRRALRSIDPNAGDKDVYLDLDAGEGCIFLRMVP